MRGRRAALVALLVALPALGEEPTTRVVLRWQTVQGAAGYDLQVARDPAFARLELDLRVEVAGYRLPQAPSDGRRYWRVRAVDRDGRPGTWSSAKILEPVLRPDPGAQPPPPPPPPASPPPAPLEVPPLPLFEPGPFDAAAAPEEADRSAGFVLGSRAEVLEPAQGPPRDPGEAGFAPADVLFQGRPGLMIGPRANLLGVAAAELRVEMGWPLPWLGGAWRGLVRAGWWQERVTVPAIGGLVTRLDARADVVPIAALVARSFPSPYARLYAGAGAGLDAVVVRVGREGALEVGGSLTALLGAGRRLGPGEAFLELAAGLGGVDGPLGRLRTGGVSLAVGYRLR